MHVGKLVASRFAQADEADLEVATGTQFMEVGRGPCEKAETANGVCASMSRDESLTPAQKLDTPGDADAIALRTTAPPRVRIVELLGSWDNFQQPYQMHHDRRRGRGFWSGCFKFENIIFDGNAAHWSKPRSGGLKQGGMYWYFFRLDYDIETYDDSRECPPARQQTLEPSDKFAALEPPPISRVHGRCVSDLALNGRLERPPSPAKSFASPPPTGLEDEQSFAELERQSSKRPSTGDGRPTSRHSLNSAPQSFSASSVLDMYGSDLRDERGYDSEPRSPISSTSVPSQPGFDHSNYAPAGQRDALAHTLSAVFEVDEGDQEVGTAIEARMHSRPVSSTGDVNLPPADHAMYIIPNTNPDDVDPGADESEQTKEEQPSEDRADSSEPDESGRAEGDVWSPTFSAATVSSNGGLSTPFRLSAGYPLEPSTSWTIDRNSLDDQNNLENVVERFESLDTSSKGEQRSANNDRQEQQYSAFTRYALPDTATGREHILSKKPSIHDEQGFSHHSRPLPTFLSSETGGSMANDIFSELGYLGGSIS
ncbi:hypothetical protein D0869_14528 [Hortaea werneckii]|uniref:Uncharacterized protein n=1 Tax=Hortaea werneckii TaxID=91943 RepID=A0A3M6W2G7_HORWE|nr:hypothetical protein D0869_14528 [Hortaea werneckii]RMX90846.1 hypothetical protein D0868_14339 [Hortaea werneckii]RMY01276.1 hypothetical protein D0867_11450 [Hortaea werneckii]RMY37528.1 hypothetical protein D0866_03213 [Hortaea werneckii]